jgi:hypothetical protein
MTHILCGPTHRLHFFENSGADDRPGRPPKIQFTGLEELAKMLGRLNQLIKEKYFITDKQICNTLLSFFEIPPLSASCLVFHLRHFPSPRSMFSVRQSAFDVQRSTFSVSPLCILHLSFSCPIPHSALCPLQSALCNLQSSIFNLPICNPPSANPQSAIRNSANPQFLGVSVVSFPPYFSFRKYL